ncbi:glycosyl transferase [Cytophagales bacterium WSM2-2]|nr:glycosyl transferase [Cytophagales bacterium WSM2-2]
MKILFLVPYPLNEAPSQRFRFEQYFKSLAQSHIQYKLKPFFKSKNYKFFFEPGRYLSKILILLGGFIRRSIVCVEALKYDFVFIHREAGPVGPPVTEWIIGRILKRKIIYDFDDAIWITDKTNEGWIEKRIRNRGKISQICQWSYKVSAGNQYLAAFAKQFNDRVVVNPTTIDLEHVHCLPMQAKPREDGRIIIGWTGSHSTLKYLKEIEPALQRIEDKYPQCEVWVIADQTPDVKLSRCHFKKWSLETEISDLAQLDIGVMPLPDDEWSKGKCGFKALQYMALEIPAIVSPVGVNTTIIEHGVTGFLAEDTEQWFETLCLLIDNSALRAQIGAAGKKIVEKNYSVQSNTNTFLKLFT